MSSIFAELIKKNLMTRDQLLELREKSSEEKKPIQDLLIDRGFLKEETLFNVAKELFPSSSIDLDQVSIDPDLTKLISLEKAMSLGVLLVRKEGQSLVVAMSDPGNVIARDELGFLTDLHVKPVLCTKSQLTKYITKCYQIKDTVHEILESAIDDAQIDLVNEQGITKEEIVDMAKSNEDDSAFVRLINKIVCDAVEARASDVHIEPRGIHVEIRYRIDGYLKSILTIPRSLHQRLSARIKILAKLDIAEQRKVQEGRIKIQMDERKIDLRISIVPIFYGEKIVLRILDRQNMKFELNDIGFEAADLITFNESIHKPQGVVLVTGPTGSGKTTTLYAALQKIKCETKNIVTIEDPIEYLIEGINQLQLNHYKDVTFANGLRSILRQDPDVILVGEIRDRETADVAFRASLTGHLVFSTMHTNNAVASITRLRDIGLEPYLIASSVILFVAQRLVRLNCTHCRKAYTPDRKLVKKFQGYMERTNVKKFYKGEGCEKCNFTGFYGRTSIFEIVKVNDKIRNLIFERAAEHLIFREAVNNGMVTLIEAGLRKVADGVTTLCEVEKVADMHEGHAPNLASLEVFRRIVPHPAPAKPKEPGPRSLSL